jgi:hypothetical protein
MQYRMASLVRGSRPGRQLAPLGPNDIVFYSKEQTIGALVLMSNVQ